MNKHSLIFILLLLFLVQFEAFGQRWKLQRYEASLGLGTTHSFMDIGSQLDGITSFRIQGTRPSVSLDARFRITQDLSVKLDLSYLMLSGIDPASRGRGYSFVTNGFEQSLRAEYTVVGEGRTFGTTALFNRRGMINNYGATYVYVFGGVGGLLAMPYVEDSDGNEVIGNPSYYNNTNYGFVFPVGIGIKISLDKIWYLGLEAGYRFSLSDVIEGYSHITASAALDQFLLVNAKAVYKIRNDRRGVPQFGRSGFRR